MRISKVSAAATLTIALLSFLLGFAIRDHLVGPTSQMNLKEPNQPVETGGGKTVSSRSPAFEALSALGYVDATFDPNSHLRDVVEADFDRTSPGFNFYNSRTGRSAHLINTRGDVVHSWKHESSENWQSSTLLPSGDVIALLKDLELIRLDLRSKLK